MSYQEFLAGKVRRWQPMGCVAIDLSSHLFDWQQRIVEWSVSLGRAAIFADCGLGKTIMQLEWARQISRHTGKQVLILAPLAVGKQTESEARRFELPGTYVRRADPIDSTIITNYEIINHFDPAEFGGIVLDESSILKSLDGKTRQRLTEFAASIDYRLCCTATPAPNDYMELGNHAEFLGVMTIQEMLAEYFTHDGGETSKWRLKRHAKDEFWRWMCSWAVAVEKPSDFGGSDDGFVLPDLRIHHHCVESKPAEGDLFVMDARTLNERRAARRASLDERLAECVKLIRKREPTLIWCDLNLESEALTKAIKKAVEIKGSDDRESKEAALLGFTEGKIKDLVTKPSIAGFGMNWQHCSNVIFFGISDSYERFYQAIRRCWRFGQKNPVDCHIITSEAEGAVVRNIERKERQATEMRRGMVRIMKEHHSEMSKKVEKIRLEPQSGERWTLHHGDCVDVLSQMQEASIDYSIFSPPFASLYTYTDLAEDMGNTKDDAEFLRHFGFAVDHLFRVIKPGRLVSFHCMNLPLVKARDGVIGLRDFRGDLIQLFSKAGFVFHSEVVIWKDPVTAMQRTKALGLLWKQLKKDSAMSRQGIPDYLVTMRKPGDNPKPISHTAQEFPVSLWQRYASPVWMDIKPSDTLQKESAREEEDERHICPLQLEVIERALKIWTADDDLVLSPFAGIGSEGYEALRLGRRFVGVELKRSYFEEACRNLEYAERYSDAQGKLFSQSDPQSDPARAVVSSLQ